MSLKKKQKTKNMTKIWQKKHEKNMTKIWQKYEFDKNKTDKNIKNMKKIWQKIWKKLNLAIEKVSIIYSCN